MEKGDESSNVRSPDQIHAKSNHKLREAINRQGNSCWEVNPTDQHYAFYLPLDTIKSEGDVNTQSVSVNVYCRQQSESLQFNQRWVFSLSEMIKRQEMCFYSRCIDLNRVRTKCCT